MNLYEIAVDFRYVADRLADLDLDEQTVLDTLEGESGALVEKGTSIAAICRNLESTAKAIKEAEASMAARRKALENRVARLKQYLLDGMTLAGIQRIESPQFVVKIANNPPSVDVFEPGLVPAEYMAEPPPPPEPAPDKKMIAKAIKDGYEVAGCRLVQGVRLDIK